MARRRTRKQKEGAHHQFTVSWDPNRKRASSEASVKRQIQKDSRSGKLSSTRNDNPEFLADIENTAMIKKEIKRSLIMASAIIAMELVLYLFLH